MRVASDNRIARNYNRLPLYSRRLALNASPLRGVSHGVVGAGVLRVVSAGVLRVVGAPLGGRVGFLSRRLLSLALFALGLGFGRRIDPLRFGGGDRRLFVHRAVGGGDFFGGQLGALGGDSAPAFEIPEGAPDQIALQQDAIQALLQRLELVLDQVQFALGDDVDPVLRFRTGAKPLQLALDLSRAGPLAPRLLLQALHPLLVRIGELPEFAHRLVRNGRADNGRYRCRGRGLRRGRGDRGCRSSAPCAGSL